MYSTKESRQDQETVRTRSYTVPAGSRLEEARVTVTAAGAAVTNLQAVVVSAPMPVVEREETRAKAKVARPNTNMATPTQTMPLRLDSFAPSSRAVSFCAAPSSVFSPLRALISSVTTSAAITAGGLALMVLPTLVVGNELLILCGVGVAVGGWFLAHRHGRLQGVVDTNKNGVDDRIEAAPPGKI